jgi:hypothetical protein
MNVYEIEKKIIPPPGSLLGNLGSENRRTKSKLSPGKSNIHLEMRPWSSVAIIAENRKILAAREKLRLTRGGILL